MMMMMMMIIIIIMFVAGNDDAQVRAAKWVRRLVVCISQQFQVWHQSRPGGICGGQSGSISSWRPTLIFPRHCHVINATHSLIWDRRNTVPVTSSVVKQNAKSRTQSYTWASFTTPVNRYKDMTTAQEKISLGSKNRWAGKLHDPAALLLRKQPSAPTGWDANMPLWTGLQFVA